MPFIGSRVTVKLSEEKKEKLKSELGSIITDIPGKAEKFLMVGFEDNYSLYFGGEKLEYGAFIEVKVFGKVKKEYFDKVTKDICNLYENELNIPKNKRYIKYEEVDNWGFNGYNF